MINGILISLDAHEFIQKSEVTIRWWWVPGIEPHRLSSKMISVIRGGETIMMAGIKDGNDSLFRTAESALYHLKKQFYPHHEVDLCWHVLNSTAGYPASGWLFENGFQWISQDASLLTHAPDTKQIIYYKGGDSRGDTFLLDEFTGIKADITLLARNRLLVDSWAAHGGGEETPRVRRWRAFLGENLWHQWCTDVQTIR